MMPIHGPGKNSGRSRLYVCSRCGHRQWYVRAPEQCPECRRFNTLKEEKK